MNLNSKRFPDIDYEPGSELFLAIGEAELPFFFDVEEELTLREEAMRIVADTLDEVNQLEILAKHFVKESLSDEDHSAHSIASYFMEFHREELDSESVSALFPDCDPEELSFLDMVDYLRVNRFGSLVNRKTGEQEFIMDLNFDPEITDELLVVYFDKDRKLMEISHES